MQRPTENHSAVTTQFAVSGPAKIWRPNASRVGKWPQRFELGIRNRKLSAQSLQRRRGILAARVERQIRSGIERRPRMKNVSHVDHCFAVAFHGTDIALGHYSRHMIFG